LRSSSETRSRPGDKSPGQSGAAAHSWTGLVKSRYQRPNEGRIRHLAHLSQSRVPAFLTLALLILGMRVCMRDLDSSRIHRRELGCFVGGGAAAGFLPSLQMRPRPSPVGPKEAAYPRNGRSGESGPRRSPGPFIVGLTTQNVLVINHAFARCARASALRTCHMTQVARRGVVRDGPEGDTALRQPPILALLAHETPPQALGLPLQGPRPYRRHRAWRLACVLGGPRDHALRLR
jgi:hypothetical protein